MLLSFFSDLKKSQDKIKSNQNAIVQIQKKCIDLNARLEKLEELAKNVDERKTQIEVSFEKYIKKKKKEIITAIKFF